jgi:hypothetical protein
MQLVSARVGVCLACLGYATCAFAQAPGGPSAADAGSAAISIPTALAIRIDGELDDAAWQRADVVTDFVQRDPSDGAAPTFRTEARVAFDDSAIYVAVRAFDPEPDKLKSFLTRRDVDSASDWIRVYIDSYHDKRTAYSFAVNPVGVKLDTYHYNDNNEDDSWDAVWDVVAAPDAIGWRAEFRIPYSQLRFAAGGDGRLGFAIAREVARINETSTWPRMPKSASGWVSSFGDLAGVARPSATKRLELVPYTVATVGTTPEQAGNPLQKNPDPGAAIGVDLKYAVTPALSLTATVNPDFGQVEADPAEVNLSAFETFFSERRPFFIEGSGTYQFDCRDCSMFYSRRIGRAPRGAPQLSEGEYSVQPLQSTILGAAKLTGRVGAFSVGVLAAVTQDEEATVARGLSEREVPVEPGTFFSVSRVRREFSDQSSLGAILTTTNRRLPGELEFLPSSATTGGLDYDWRIGRRWGLNGYWSGSLVRGSAAAISSLQLSNVHSFQRPDADHVELDPLAESLGGHSGNINFAKIAGQRTRMNVNIGYKSPGFDTNDVGFMQRADQIPQNSWLQVRFDTPGKYVRNTRINFNQWSSHNFDGDRLSLGFNFNAHWSFQNQWSSGFGINLNAPGFDDRMTRGGPGGKTVGNINSWQYVSTDDRKFVSLGWESDFGRRPHGSHWFNVEPSVTFRPSSAVSAEFGIKYNVNVNDSQWVRSVVDAAAATHYVFGRLDQTTTAMTTRVNYTLTPTLSLQVYAQPFVSAGVYESYKELVAPRASAYADRFAPFAYGGNADFNVLSFRTTNVMRWEFKPGSSLFVVWQQGREGFQQRGDYNFGRDFGDVFSTPSSNTLLVKLAYWLNP